ncbi:hypothetical protein BJ165DRAFT_1489922 [Panaeolus papilionaceus]|nr:hypothetical protein BJ165DRAFT_1489922 [Panaeolus papilionaceus]
MPRPVRGKRVVERVLGMVEGAVGVQMRVQTGLIVVRSGLGMVERSVRECLSVQASVDVGRGTMPMPIPIPMQVPAIQCISVLPLALSMSTLIGSVDGIVSVPVPVPVVAPVPVKRRASIPVFPLSTPIQIDRLMLVPPAYPQPPLRSQAYPPPRRRKPSLLESI